MLRSLPAGTPFEIVSFGSHHASLFKEARALDDASLGVASRAIDKMNADMGGTNILAPLESVFERKLPEGFAREVVLLTDGQVSNVDQVVKLVQANANSARTFALGIGSGASRDLVRRLASSGRGKAEFVADDERVETKVVRLLRSALQPAFTDVTVEWSDG